MKGLLTKDFRLFLQQKRFFAVLILIAGILNFGTDGSFAVTYMTFMGLIFVMNTISYDEYDNGMPFLMALPVSRKMYAREKYVFGIILGLAMWLTGVALALGSWLINSGKGDCDVNEIIVTAAASIPVFVIIISLMLPIQLKFGAEKGRIALVVVAGVIFLAAYGLKMITTMTGIDISGIDKVLSAISINVLLPSLAFATVIILLISIAISSIIMEKKEF